MKILEYSLEGGFTIKRLIKNYKLKRIYPLLFWKKCCKCQQEFKKEHGWKLSFSYRHDICEMYLCNDCAKTESEARDIIENSVLAKQIIIPKGGSGRMIKATDKPCPCKPSKQY